MSFRDGALQVWAPGGMCPVTPPRRVEVVSSVKSDEACCVSADDSDDDLQCARFFAVWRSDGAARARAPEGGAVTRAFCTSYLGRVVLVAMVTC